MGRREQKKAATRAAIATAAHELIVGDGFERVTADAIAARAGVSRATFFRYFATKEGAFLAGGADDLERFADLLRATADGADPIDTLRGACLAIAADYMADRELRLQRFRVVREARTLADYDARLDARWEQALADALRDHLGDDDAAVVAGAFFGTMRAVVRRWLEGDAQADLVAAGERAFAILDTGIRAALAGRREPDKR